MAAIMRTDVSGIASLRVAAAAGADGAPARVPWCERDHARVLGSAVGVAHTAAHERDVAPGGVRSPARGDVAARVRRGCVPVRGRRGLG